MIKRSKNKGFLLIQVLVFGTIAVVIVGGLITFAATNIKLGRHVVLSEQAFQMAEAGLEYYRWHLAHAPMDYTNGTGQPGPYVKDFLDKDGNLLGTFSLAIEVPPLGSTLVKITSTGIPAADPSIKRSIVSMLAIPSFANFAVAANDFMRFGVGTEVFGPIHSNRGIRFDGLAHNLVTSASTTYDDPDHDGSNEFAVHTHKNAPPSTTVNDNHRPLEAPTNSVQPRPDVFVAGRSFPAPQIPFSNLTLDIAQMKTDAQAEGLYRATSTTGQGYRLVLKTNDTLDLYQVNSLQSVPNNCTGPTGSGAQPGWGSWSIASSTLLGTYAYPANGLMFFNDHIWVEGQIDGARLTIVAANVPDAPTSARKSITVNGDIQYTNYDGADVIALIAQDNFNIGFYSANDIKIDAALIAQNGRVGRYNYQDTDCTPNRIRNSLTLYGTIITSQRYGFAYGNPAGGGTAGNGYVTRNITYDAFLLYTPPPFFPKIEDFHEVIFWKEV